MSTAIRNNRLSSEDKTAEFELPDFTNKGTVVPPTPIIQEKVQSLRSETKEIKTQIEQVKTEAVRKQDESTRVFNLRQAQLVQKIKDLELKKAQTEKTIQKMLDDKSSDLAKTSKNIDELTEGMAKLTALRNELQNFLEQATAERKKNSDVLINQGVEIQNLGKMLQNFHDILTREFSLLSNSLRPLVDEKVALEKSCIELKAEFGKVESEIKDFESKKFSLTVAVADVERKLEYLKDLESQYKGNLDLLSRKSTETQSDIEKHKQTCRDLEQKQESLEQEISRLRDQQDLMNKGSESIKWSLVSLTEQHDQKKNSVARVDQEMVDLKKRIEDLGNKEADLVKSCGNYATNLHHLQGEVAGLEASRMSAFKLQEEAMVFLNERREFYQQHAQELEYNHKTKIGLLEKDYKDQKAEWEKSFQLLEEQQKAELTSRLEEHTVKYHSALKETQNVLMDEIVKIVKRHLGRTVFESGQQRADFAQEELVPLLKNYFNQTTTIQPKFWHQWKLWSYAFAGSLTVIFGLIIKILWFK